MKRLTLLSCIAQLTACLFASAVAAPSQAATNMGSVAGAAEFSRAELSADQLATARTIAANWKPTIDAACRACQAMGNPNDLLKE